MLANITFWRVAGLPLLAWGGLFTFLILILTALVAYLTVKNIKPLPVKWHIYLAYLTLLLTFFHGLAALLSFIGK